ncbi:hypothetical protein P3X46_015030 [Hevea brasiliensis]|uniref:pectinesterase n=1 Tax=Hevea brasiliensis TaxID=3981 RepID=A0ABQ9LUL9_HEVBR|nr:hypothetical protein P3X46_015030 [Hevea brasiliensis]
MLLVVISVCKALDCQLNESNQYKVAYTVLVDKSGEGNFDTIQSAIDSIPENNTQWIRVIPVNKPCIFLEGAGSEYASIESDDHQDTPTSAIFISYSDNIVAKGITFKNTYNLQIREDKIIWMRAPAIRIRGDKSALYNCAFLGYKTPFVMIRAVTTLENATLKVLWILFLALLSLSTSGFVFKNCEITGTGIACLGRAWGPYSTVIIYNSTISDVVVPQGWSAWGFVGHEANFTHVEANNSGPGADTSNRVPWLKKLDDSQLSIFVNISYIDEDGWIAKLPTVS